MVTPVVNPHPHSTATVTWQRVNRLILLGGGLTVAMTVIAMQALPLAGWIQFLDNVHWTVSTAIAALLAWRCERADPDHRPSLRWIAYGLSAYALGQMLWNIQTMLGYGEFPAPADLFYLMLGPGLIVALVREIQAQTTPAQRQLIWLDSGLLTVAMLTLILVLYIPQRGDTALLALLTLIAYPATLFAASALYLIMIPALRLRLNAGLLLFLLALLVTAGTWMRWNAMTLQGINIDGAWFNPLFSLACLLFGYSLPHWRLQRHPDPAWDRLCEGALRQLPLAAVVTASLAVVLSHTLSHLAASTQLIADLGCVLVIVLAVLRQNALLKERDQLLSTQQALLTSQRALAQERGLLKTLVGAIPDLVWLKDAEGRYLSCNARFEQFFGAREREILGKTDHDFVAPELADFFRRHDAIAMHANKPCINQEQLTFAEGGYNGLFETTKTAARDSEGRLIGVLGIAHDITERHQIQEQQRIAAAAFESMDGMMITDAHNVILRVNQAFTRITGYTADEAVGQTPRLLRSQRHSAEFYQAMWHSIEHTGGWQGEIWDQRKNGEVYPKWLTITAIKDPAGTVTHYLGAHHDITERKQSEERINELAFFDPLTTLPNRTLLQDRLRQRIAVHLREGGFSALLFLDLDHFKTINDTLGHDMGDLMLQQVGLRLRQCVRDADTVARLGGDEFVVMLTGLGFDVDEAKSRTEAVAAKILLALRQPYPLRDSIQYSSASIGATLFGDQRTDTESLLKQADLAMYTAKAAGRNSVRFFDPSMEADVLAQAALEADLRVALQTQQFALHYQAQLNAQGQVTGAEALARWSHPTRGMVSPARFIALAEETGLILTLGHWVLVSACTQLALWAREPELAPLTLSVNISAHQLRQSDFVTQVQALLQSTGAPPRLLQLELTESVLMVNLEDVIEKMHALKALGVRFSLDDFGTGFSSLTYLKRLPLDELKIDQSFVRDLLTDANDAAFVKTIIALAASLELTVIAEGVETVEQRDFLAQAGCHAYQGYLFHHPAPAAQLEAFARGF